MRPKVRYAVALALLVALLAGCGGGGAPALTPQHTRVLLVGWDAVQREHLWDMLAAGEVPNLQALGQEGSLIPSDITAGYTDTRCGWAQILTGCRPEITHIHSNHARVPIARGLTIYERAKKRYGLAGKSIFTAHLSSKDKNLNGSTMEDPYYYARDAVDRFASGLHDRANVLREAFDALDAHAGESFFIFVHFYEPDNAGHAYGENSPEYEAGIRQCDEALGQLRAHLDALGIADQTALIVTTDHGFNEGADKHFDAPHTWLASNQRLTHTAGDRLDVGPTILQWLGMNPRSFNPPTDGKPL